MSWGLSSGDAVVRAATTTFWGVLVVVFDLKLNSFDIVNDVIGYLMIASGAITLRRTGIAHVAGLASLLVFLASVGTVFAALATVAGPLPRHEGLEAAGHVLHAAGLFTLVEMFRVAAATLGRARLDASWSMTRRFVLADVAATAVLTLVTLEAFVSGRVDDDANLAVRPGVFIVFAVVAIAALVATLVSLHRTKNAPVPLTGPPDTAYPSPTP